MGNYILSYLFVGLLLGILEVVQIIVTNKDIPIYTTIFTIFITVILWLPITIYATVIAFVKYYKEEFRDD